MSKLKLLLGVVTVALAIGATTAIAADPGPTTCSSGTLAPGTYTGLNVTGTCVVNGNVTVNGNVSVAPGAYLDAAYLGTQLTVNGDITVGQKAKLGLGCSFGYHDCGTTPTWLGKVVVNGNVIAVGALTMYIDFTTVHGNLISIGGGDITMVDHPPAEDGLVLPIKDNVVDGNIIVEGWQGAWFGIIRNTVGGNVIAQGTTGTRHGEGNLPDSTEIVTNHISGNLICQGNTPAAQIGDSGGTVNTVSGVKIGECTAV